MARARRDLRAYSKRWHANPINKARQEDLRLRRTYGITLEDVERMRIEQRGLCKICQKAKELFIDHDHATKKIRGLLCMQCNLLLGFFDEDPIKIGSAIRYLDAEAL